MRPALRILFCLAVLSASPSAQELAPTDIGTLAPLTFYAGPTMVREWKATPADVKAIEATARRLARLIAEVPALNPPRGFNASLSAVLTERDVVQARVRPVLPFPIFLRLGAWRIPRQSITSQVLHQHDASNDLGPPWFPPLGGRSG